MPFSINDGNMPVPVTGVVFYLAWLIDAGVYEVPMICHDCQLHINWSPNASSPSLQTSAGIGAETGRIVANFSLGNAGK